MNYKVNLRSRLILLACRPASVVKMASYCSELKQISKCHLERNETKKGSVIYYDALEEVCKILWCVFQLLSVIIFTNAQVLVGDWCHPCSHMGPCLCPQFWVPTQLHFTPTLHYRLKNPLLSDYDFPPKYHTFLKYGTVFLHSTEVSPKITSIEVLAEVYDRAMQKSSYPVGSCAASHRVYFFLICCQHLHVQNCTGSPPGHRTLSYGTKHNFKENFKNYSTFLSKMLSMDKKSLSFSLCLAKIDGRKRMTKASLKQYHFDYFVSRVWSWTIMDYIAQFNYSLCITK